MCFSVSGLLLSTFNNISATLSLRSSFANRGRAGGVARERPLTKNDWQSVCGSHGPFQRCAVNESLFFFASWGDFQNVTRYVKKLQSFELSFGQPSLILCLNCKIINWLFLSYCYTNVQLCMFKTATFKKSPSKKLVLALAISLVGTGIFFNIQLWFFKNSWMRTIWC